MAITRNVWLRGAKQKAGGMVFYQAQGETRFRELAASVRNPRTEKQMAQRVRWANLVNFYRANRNWMQRAFENKPQNNTDYNRFMSLNGGTSDIYLTKQEANAGACVVNNYRVTDGTLPAIEVTPSGANWVTNIWTGDLTAINANTTVGQFAQALLNSNAGLRVNDQLSFIRMSQQSSPSMNTPFVIVRAYEVLLNPYSAELLGDYFPVDYFDVETVGGVNTLRVTNSGNAGGFVLVLSRTEGGIIRVSPQDVVVANNSALIARYSSAVQQQLAADSYGEGTEVFLSSASAGEINPYGMEQSILSVTTGAGNYTAGDEPIPRVQIAGTSFSIQMANEIPEASVVSVATTRVAGQGYNAATNVTFEGAIITATGYAYTGDTAIISVQVVIDGTTYSINFEEGENELG